MNSEGDDFPAALDNIAVARQSSHWNVLCTSMDVGPRLCHEAFPGDWTSRRDYIQASQKHNGPPHPHLSPSLSFPDVEGNLGYNATLNLANLHRNCHRKQERCIGLFS